MAERGHYRSPEVRDPLAKHCEVFSIKLPGVLLDEKIAPVIDFLATNGVSTLYCCQGDPDQDLRSSSSTGYIMFASTSELLNGTRLLAMLALAAENDGLAARCLGRDTLWLADGRRAHNSPETGLRPWRFEIDRDPKDWEPSDDHFRASAWVNYEDVVSLGALLDY